ncbi:MAG: hypothetical protein M3Q30_18780 [Actinomycetota bacterium]|nr:hypothetical protein [Actinomycetota bacterium]
MNARRVALGTFIGVEAASLVLFVRVGRFAWFSQDEWDFLANRSAGDLGDLFRPKNEHWTTLPILAFRCLWWLFGLRSYVPYLVLVVTLHLIVAALLRAVMRRADVGPWLSTAVASAFALFGTGYFNIEYAFQITFVGSLAFGLAHLLLADHDGAPDWRDGLGILAGLASLACSGVGLAMAVVVGIAVLVKRGIPTALLHVGPLGGAYLVWFLVIGHEGERAARGANFEQTIRFMTRELRATFGALGQLPGVGIALAVVLVVGLAIAWGPLRGALLHQRAAVPAALLFGAAVFLLTTAISRGGPFATSTPPAPASRYRYIIAALVLPALAVAAEAVSRRWRTLAPVVLVLVLVGIPGNVRVLVDNTPDWRVYKLLVLSAPRLPISAALPRSVRPVGFGNPWLTMGWLRDGIASGRIPEPKPLTPEYVAFRTLGLALQPARSVTRRPCLGLPKPVVRVLATGQVLMVKSGTVLVSFEPLGGAASPARLLHPGTYVAVAGPLRLRLSPVSANEAAVVCG